MEGTTSASPQKTEHDTSFELAIQRIRALLALNKLKNDREPAQIIEGLYLGSIGAAMSKDTLQNLEISHILTVADSIKPTFPELFTYKIIAILDNPSCDIGAVFDETFDFIDSAIESGQKVLVHW